MCVCICIQLHVWLTSRMWGRVVHSVDSNFCTNNIIIYTCNWLPIVWSMFDNILATICMHVAHTEKAIKMPQDLLIIHYTLYTLAKYGHTHTHTHGYILCSYMYMYTIYKVVCHHYDQNMLIFGHCLATKIFTVYM